MQMETVLLHGLANTSLWIGNVPGNSRMPVLVICDRNISRCMYCV